MQLQHPELLWGLLLLIIPILVHLLRLRRFRTTPFTNVRILERILAESNKSSRLKKWLLLLSRLVLLAALVLAFCQPFIPAYSTDKENEIVVFLDNSFSMQARVQNTDLLQQSIQEILQFFPEELRFTLVTHSEMLPEVRVNDIQERLLDLDFSSETLGSEALRFRIESLFSKSDSIARQLWLLSDFRDWDPSGWESWDYASVMAVQARSNSLENYSLDTAYIAQGSPENLQLTVEISGADAAESLPVSLYDGDKLVAKTGTIKQPGGMMKANFTLPETQILHGTLQVSDNSLSYDNTLFLTLNPPRKINVVSLGTAPSAYLSRIFTPESFNLQQSTLRQLDYSVLQRQHLIVLNELDQIPMPLLEALGSFTEQGGNLVVIPSARADLTSYNRLLESLGSRFQSQIPGEILITEINFDHPLYRGVFEKSIDIFEYPRSSIYYPLTGNLSNVIAYQNGQPFLAAGEGTYIFSAPLSSPHSNFTLSPLIVPTLYAMGKSGLPRAELYYQIGQDALLDLNVSLQEDEILEVSNPEYSFIPLQQSFARKTRLTFGEEPSVAGNYQVQSRGEAIEDLSFNYSRAESRQAMKPVTLPESFEVHPDVQSLVKEYQNSTRITSLWKWFVILALLFVLVEMLIQKTMR